MSMPPKRKQTDYSTYRFTQARKLSFAEKALEEVQRILSTTSGDELSVLKDFAEVFSIAVRGWELRVEELEAEAERHPDKHPDRQPPQAAHS